MLPPRLTRCGPNRVCLNRTPDLPLRVSLGIGKDNAGTVKRALNCDERAGVRIGPTPTWGKRVFQAYPIGGQREDGRIDGIVRPDTAGSSGGDPVTDLECASAVSLCAEADPVRPAR